MSYPIIAEIDLTALRKNLQKVRQNIGPGCRILAVVKANAYGHGAVPVARELVSSGVSMLGVVWVHEGVELRQAGIQCPILVMGGVIEDQAGAVLDFQLTPVVFQVHQVKALEQFAGRKNGRIGIHLKIDTGMGRLGTTSRRELADLIRVLGQSSHLSVEGAMTHLAENGLADRKFTGHQLQSFQTVLEFLAREGIQIPIRHAANSAITMDLPSAHLNMVRPGIMLYGYLPTKHLAQPLDLQPVLSLKTALVHLKRVPAGTPISYGLSYVTRRDSLIGTIPIGYADGLPRALSSRGEVLVGNRRVPIIGKVCMDMTMVDLTGLDSAKVGDPVVLIGRQGQEIITADEIAERSETISYEILSRLGPRVRRVYQNGVGTDHKLATP